MSQNFSKKGDISIHCVHKACQPPGPDSAACIPHRATQWFASSVFKQADDNTSTRKFRFHHDYKEERMNAGDAANADAWEVWPKCTLNTVIKSAKNFNQHTCSLPQQWNLTGVTVRWGWGAVGGSHWAARQLWCPQQDGRLMSTETGCWKPPVIAVNWAEAAGKSSILCQA